MCYVILFTFAIFYVKKQAFCSSNQLYDVERSRGPQETFIYSLPWSYRRINGTVFRRSTISHPQPLPLLAGDIEPRPGLVARCGLCLKAAKKNQSKIPCSKCHLMFHLKCFGLDDSEVFCSSCFLDINIRDELDHNQQDDFHRYGISELSELVSKKGLKIMHQSIRGLLAKTKMLSAKSRIVLGIYIFYRSVKLIYHLKTKLRRKLEAILLLKSQKFQDKVEVLFLFVCFFSKTNESRTRGYRMHLD